MLAFSFFDIAFLHIEPIKLVSDKNIISFFFEKGIAFGDGNML